MKKFILNNINNHLIKTAKILITTVFIFQMLLPIPMVQGQASLDFFLPAPGEMVTQSQGYQPVLIKGVTINPNNPFQFDFIIDKGDSGLTGYSLKEISEKLIKYFMTSLTIPEEELWVNLSPYEDDRIIPQNFGYTEMGRDLLAQDYVLKQLTSSLLYPEKELGEKFWDKVYEKIFDDYCNEDSPHAMGEECDIRNLTIDTFNKVWIVPDKAVVYEHDQTAFIAESHLKVLLESDYAAMSQYHDKKKDRELQKQETKNPELATIASEIVKKIIIPEIEKEVNHGEHFAQLRQITNSLILASWYKKRLKESVLSQVYVNQAKVNGVDVEDKDIKNKIYHQYIEAFTTGVFNLIKEDYNPATQQVIPRKYFSGGKDYTQISHTMDIEEDFAHMTRTGQEEITKTIQLAQEGTDVFTVKANFEIDNTTMNSQDFDKLAAEVIDLEKINLDNQTMSYFVNRINQLSDTINKELTEEQYIELGRRLGLSDDEIGRIYNDTYAMAKSAAEFADTIDNDGKMNVFFMRDAYPLYAASKLSGKKSYAMEISKASFRLFTQNSFTIDLLIPTIIIEIKQRMGIEKTAEVPAEQFAEFKENFFSFLEELISDTDTINVRPENASVLKYRDGLRNSIPAIMNYLNLIGMDIEDIARDGIRFIDTTATGTFVLFMEGITRLLLKQHGLEKNAINEKTDGRMFYSNLSPAFRYKENVTRIDGKKIESNYLPVQSARELSPEGEPLIKIYGNNAVKNRFILQLALMKSDLLRIQRDNIRKSDAATQNTSEDFALPTFDEAKQNLVIDIYKSINSTPINLNKEIQITTPEDLQNYLEASSYVWQSAHESKKRNLLGILGALQKHLVGFLERQYPGINIKSISISGSMAEFWASYPEKARLPFGEDIDVYVVSDQVQAGSLKLSLERLYEGQAISEEIADFGAYGVNEIDVWMAQEGTSDVDFYMLFGSGVTIWGNPIEKITTDQRTDQIDPLMVIGRVERLIGPNAWDMTGRLVVANWLLKGLAQGLNVPYTDYDQDINANKAEARDVIEKNYEQIMIALANKKMNAQKVDPPKEETENEDFAGATTPDAKDSAVGGIDLNTNFMDMKINRTGAALTIPVDLQKVQTMQIDGLVPVIFNISPTTNLQPLLGIGINN